MQILLFQTCAIALFTLTCGCATVPYHPTSATDYPGVYPCAKDEPEVVRDRANGFLDASELVLAGESVEQASALEWERG